MTHMPLQNHNALAFFECSRVRKAYAELHGRQRELVVRAQIAVNVDERAGADRDRRRARIVIVCAPNVPMAQTNQSGKN